MMKTHFPCFFEFKSSNYFILDHSIIGLSVLSDVCYFSDTSPPLIVISYLTFYLLRVFGNSNDGIWSESKDFDNGLISNWQINDDFDKFTLTHGVNFQEFLQ